MSFPCRAMENRQTLVGFLFVEEKRGRLEENRRPQSERSCRNKRYGTEFAEMEGRSPPMKNHTGKMINISEPHEAILDIFRS